MYNIEYIDEEVKEEIFEGTYILDGQHLTEKQQREKIFNLMRQVGLDVSDESKLEISYEGADDDYGTSETQSTKFIVTRTITKKVPYKVSKEAIFEGTFILDGLRLTEEQQREKIFNLMKQTGLDISKEEFDTFEIGYEGADDDYGTSETQSTKFVVSRIIKTRLDSNPNVNSREDYENVLKEIKSLREKLDTIVNDVTRTDIIQELMDKTDGLEKMISSERESNSNVYTEAIKEIDEQLKEIEKKLKEAIKSYEESYEKMRELLSEQNEKIETSDLLTDDEYNEIMREFLGKKVEENEKTIAIKKEIEARKKQITILKRKKNKIKKDLLQADSLGISPSSYQNITNTLMKRKIVNAILQTKGLNEIIDTPYKERTKEQNKKLKEAKEEIISEIAKLQKSQENVSVLDAIEALYGIDTEMVLKGKAREYQLTEQELDNVRDNVSLLPEKIVVRDKKLLNNNVLNSINPTDAPLDMLEIYDKKSQELQETVEDSESNTLEDNKEAEVVERPVDNITLYVDEDNSDVYGNGYVFDRFHIKKHNDEKLIDGEAYYKMDEEDADYIIENKDNTYSPYTVETKNVKIEKEQETVDRTEVKKLVDKITVYIDTDNNNEIYANRSLFGRFNVDMLGDEIRIDGKACFRMNEEDATFILGNQDNSYSPYVVETREIQLGKREEKETNEQLTEKMIIYIDTDNNNEFYGNRYLFNRFNMDTLSNDIRIDGRVCFRMSEEDATFILGNQENNYSPYKVEIREVQLGKKEVNNRQEVKEQDENKNEVEIKEQLNNTNLNTPVERITLYKGNNGEVYGRKYLFDRFNMDEASDSVIIDGAVCFKINPEDLDFIVGNQDNNYSPYFIETKEANLDDVRENSFEDSKDSKEEVMVKEDKLNIETILANLTKDLDIEAKDCPSYMASNIHVSEDFSKELHNGDVSYNVVHVVPGRLKADTGLVKKLSSKLLLSTRGKKSMHELVERLNNLSEEELEVLFEEYKGSRLETDTNSQINPIILDRLREYGLEKVTLLNEDIKDNYAKLFVIFGEIKVLDEKTSKEGISESEVQALVDERNKLLQAASCNVINIKDDRKKANDLLSSGVKGLEEDFKAVAFKLNYVGFKFAKSNEFDNELQHQLGKYGQDLNIAIANNDYEGIVKNFMGLESLYYENTEIKGSALINGSVGSKCYASLAEQFGYRDDSFIRDLLSCVANNSVGVNDYSVIDEINDVASRYCSGSINQTEALKVITNIANNSSVSLASRISTYMNENYADKVYLGDEVSDMMDDYLDSKDELEESRRRGR